MKKIYFLCFLMFFASQNSDAQKMANYLTNGNFESWSGGSPSSWSLVSTPANSTITQETTNVVSNSTNSVKFVPTVVNKGIFQSSTITITTAGKYYFGVWIKTDANAVIKFGFKQVSGGSTSYPSSSYTAPDTDWHFVVRATDVVAGDELNARFIPQSSGLNVIFYFDNAYVGEGLAGGNVEWDSFNGTAKTYTNFYGTQSYGGSTNGTLTENTDASYVKSGYNSLSLVTSADATSAKRGVIVLTDNSNQGNRYEHPASTRKYQLSAWVYTLGDADIVLNTKTGSTNNFSNHSITANTWTQIFSSIITLDADDAGDKVYPIIQFKTPSTTHYVDDVYLNWDGIKWEGGTSSDWDTASNWSSNMVPNPVSEVTIPSGLSNYPTAASAVTVASVDMAAGTSLISTSTFSGTVKYTRTLADTSDDWYLVSSPVNAQDIDVFIAREGLASGTTDNNIGLTQRYNTGTDTWTYYQSGASGYGNFTPGKGYAIKLATAGQDIYFEGTIRNSDQSRTLDTSANAFNFVANPYTSYMDTATMLTENSGVLASEAMWIWNSSTGSYDTKVTEDTYKLAPAQGFFVKSNGNAGTLALNQSYEVHNSSDTFQRPDQRPEIYLTLSDGSLSRLAKIYYVDGATTSFDNGYDGEMFGGVANEFAIYTHYLTDSEGQDLAIQSLPPNNFENMIIPLGINAEAGTAITIDAVTNNFPSGINIYLEDKQDNSFTLLDTDANFSFTPENNLSGIGRFYLHTTSSVLSADDFATNNNISIYTSSKDNLRIVGVQNGTATVQLYNILGKEMLKTSFEGNGVNDINLNTIPMGIYIVKLATENGVLNRKIIIQ